MCRRELLPPLLLLAFHALSRLRRQSWSVRAGRCGGRCTGGGFSIRGLPYLSYTTCTHACTCAERFLVSGGCGGGGGGVADGIRLPLVVRGSWDSGGGCHKLVDIYDPHKGVAVAIFDGVLCASLKREPADGRGRGFFGLVIVPVRPS